MRSDADPVRRHRPQPLVASGDVTTAATAPEGAAPEAAPAASSSSPHPSRPGPDVAFGVILAVGAYRARLHHHRRLRHDRRRRRHLVGDRHHPAGRVCLRGRSPVRRPGPRLGRVTVAAVRGAGRAHRAVDRLVGAARPFLAERRPDLRLPGCIRRRRRPGASWCRTDGRRWWVRSARRRSCCPAMRCWSKCSRRRWMPATTLGRLQAPFGYWNATGVAAAHGYRPLPVGQARAECPGACCGRWRCRRSPADHRRDPVLLAVGGTGCGHRRRLLVRRRAVAACARRAIAGPGRAPAPP